MAGRFPLKEQLVSEGRSATRQGAFGRPPLYDRQAWRRDQFLEQVELEPLELRGYLKALRKTGLPLKWTHSPGLCMIEAGRWWVRIEQRRGARIRTNIGKI